MEKMKKKRWRVERSSQALRQFLLTYLIVFIVPLLICSVYIFHVIYILGEDDLEFRRTELNHAVDLVDDMLEEFESMGDLLAAGEQVSLFKYRNEEVWVSPNTYRLNELRDSLPQILMMNQNVFNYFIFFDQSNLVINDRDIYTWEDFYDLYLKEEKYKTYEEWKESMLEAPMTYGVNPEASYVYRKAQRKRLLCFSRPLITADGTNRAGIWILFEKNAIADRLPSLTPDSVQYIVDKNGQLIYYQAGEKVTETPEEVIRQAEQERQKCSDSSVNMRISGQKYHLLSKNSERSSFCYYVLYTDSLIKQRMISVLLAAFVIVIFSVAAGICLSYMMSKKTLVPINDILSDISRVMEKNETHQSVFASLKSNFAYLVRQNSSLSATIEDQKPYLRNGFVTRLLLGDIHAEEEARKRADYLGLEHEGRVFLLLLFCFEMKWDEMDPELVTTCVLSLTEAMEKELPGSFHAGLETNQVVLLLSVDPDRLDTFRKDMEEHVEHMKTFMPTSIAEHLFVYGSSIAGQMTDLSEAYRKSCGMFRYDSNQVESTIYWYSQRTDHIELYPSGVLESRLVSLVLAGDWQGLHDELELLMKNWVLGNNMSAYYQQMLFGELQLILIRILDRLDAEPEELKKFYGQLEKNMGLPLISQIPITLNLYRDICEFIQTRDHFQDLDGLMANVTTYIEMNYADCCLSLAQVASRYSVSESYLSTMFKNSQGIKFSSYVEGVRISRAKELLESTNLTVREISEQVGYTSANSFCRAFRRVTGINTSEYRKK